MDTPNNLLDFETYLNEAKAQGIIDFHLRYEINSEGTPKFYIHPQNTGGKTADYAVNENTLMPMVVCGDWKPLWP
jgi:hypothetical protein